MMEGFAARTMPRLTAERPLSRMPESFATVTVVLTAKAELTTVL
jgi:hypothetical protein